MRYDPWLSNARVSLALDHIDAHAAQPLTTDDLARAVGWSPSSLHRAFVELFGCAPAAYIRTQRLESAALLLIQRPELRLADVAAATGFASPEVFCRGFVKHFGMTASVWRSGGHRAWRAETLREHAQRAAPARPLQAQRRWQLEDTEAGRRLWYELDFEARTDNPHEFDVQVCDASDLRIVYSRAVGTYGNADAMWMQHLRWCESQGLIGEDTLVYISWLDDPSVTPAHRCRHDVGVVVPRSAPVKTRAVRTIPGGSRAVLDFHGRLDGLPYAWQWLAHDWMRRHARRPMSVPPYLLMRACELPWKRPRPSPMNARICFSLGRAVGSSCGSPGSAQGMARAGRNTAVSA